MKKLVLLTGALLSLGALSACGNKQAKNIDMAIKEMDDKFKIPDGLLVADENFARYARQAAEENLYYAKRVPQKTVYQSVTNLNAAVGLGKVTQGDPYKTISSDVVSDPDIYQLPIDSSAVYRNDYTETMSLYDNYLSEYILSGRNKYTNEGGSTLDYKNVSSLYNYWPEQEKDKDTYAIRNYVEESKAYKAGTFNYKTLAGSGLKKEDAEAKIKAGVGKQVINMYKTVTDKKPTLTVVGSEDKDTDLQRAAQNFNEKTIKKDGYDKQFKYYWTSDHKTIYLYQSEITGSSYVYPTNQIRAPFMTDKDIIPVYSVMTRVSKLTHYDLNDIHAWQVDYYGMFGKTYTTKDNNLITYDKPKCVASEYYYISSDYNSIGSMDFPLVEEVEEYNNEDFAGLFKGFAIQNYHYNYFTTDGNVDPEGVYYTSLNYSINNSARQMYSDMAPTEEEASEGKIPSSMNATLKLSDKTVQYRAQSTDSDKNQTFYLHGQFQTSRLQTAMLVTNPDAGWKKGGNAFLFGILTGDKTDFTEEDIKKSGNENILIPNDDNFLYDGDTFSGEHDHGCKGVIASVEAPVDPDYEAKTDYPINCKLDGTYDVDIYIKMTSNDKLSFKRVEVYYNNATSGGADVAL